MLPAFPAGPAATEYILFKVRLNMMARHLMSVARVA